MPRLIEIRRHTLRSRPGIHLSQAGVMLARRVGESSGPFLRVVTSTQARAYETAIAMGFAVDEQSELMSMPGDEVEREIPWSQSFASYAVAVGRGGAAADYAKQLREFYHHLAVTMPGDGNALVINHGTAVELGVIGCLPHLDLLAGVGTPVIARAHAFAGKTESSWMPSCSESCNH